MSICKHSIFVLILITLFVPRCLADTPDLRLHNKCLYPTVMVALEGRNSGGTGIIIRSTKVGNEYHNVFLTAGHVVNHSSLFNVHVYEYQDHSTIKEEIILPCSFYAIDMKRDLAIGVFVSDKKMPTAEINFNPKVFIGNDVLRIGCGLGDEPRLDVGKISSVKTTMGHHLDMIRTTIHTLPGDSGSGLFSDYKIIGIMIMIRGRDTLQGRQIFPMMSYAVPIQNFQTWSIESNNALSFGWDNKKIIPMLPIYEIKLMRDFEIIEEE